MNGGYTYYITSYFSMRLKSKTYFVGIKGGLRVIRTSETSEMRPITYNHSRRVSPTTELLELEPSQKSVAASNTSTFAALFQFSLHATKDYDTR